MTTEYTIQRNAIYTDAEVAFFVQPKEYDPLHQNYFNVLVSVGVDALEVEKANDPIQLRQVKELELARRVRDGLNAYAIYDKETWDEQEELRNTMKDAQERWHKAEVKMSSLRGFIYGSGTMSIIISLASLLGVL